MCTNMCTYAAENRQNVKYLHVQCTLYTVEMCAEILKYFYAVNKLNNATCRDLKMWILSSKYVGGHRNMLCKSDEYRSQSLFCPKPSSKLLLVVAGFFLPKRFL